MADEAGSPFSRVGWLVALAREPYVFDFHQAMRRLERAFPALPRWGEALRPSDEPVRLGQDPFLNFAPSTLTSFKPPSEGRPAELKVAFFGLFGPHGPLPLHLTEYVRERIRNVGDETIAAFANLFHHRLLVLFQRAWAQGRPTASRDRRSTDAFVRYVGAICGLGLRSQRAGEASLSRARLGLAGRLAPQVKNPDGLRAVLTSYFALPVGIDEFIGQWFPIPDDARWRLGRSPEVSRLGQTAVIGERVFLRTQKFRVVLGPLSGPDFTRFLPPSRSLDELTELTRGYAGSELAWELELVPAAGSSAQLCLGKRGQLGFDAVLGAVQKPLRRAHVVVDPVSKQTRRLLA
ncbi:MAG TPA: type VI secretion system baseplate subunit TssG [Polyangiaceae bacterium]|nr:type VI secretion system baseplate subunit TssG [Polyangiaceae bacterium]